MKTISYLKNAVKSAMGLKGSLPNVDTSSLKISDFSPDERELMFRCKAYTMAGLDRMASLVDAVKQVVHRGVPGSFVECGVWRGGSMMLVAHVLTRLGETSRDLYLYDTFEGMTEPGSMDRRRSDGVKAGAVLSRDPKGQGNWCAASLEEVKRNMNETGYPSEKIHFVKGDVQATIPAVQPDKIALLRLDTDWYASTLHELQCLYPLVSSGGVLIFDDYGHWEGSRKAVDEFFSSSIKKPFLHRIDYSARLLVKC